MTDRIEKEIQIQAPRSRVWKALTDAKEFGTWFQIALDGPFLPNTRVDGRMRKKGYEHVVVEFQVETIEPEHRFTYRWHPYCVDPNIDYSKEPTTLIEFTLEDRDGGTLLRVVESGFDGIPISRRAEALKMNDGGWAYQLKAVAAYVEPNR
jgi:uncharacterized protein YndB with AHSA1/START domain